MDEDEEFEGRDDLGHCGMSGMWRGGGATLHLHHHLHSLPIFPPTPHAIHIYSSLLRKAIQIFFLLFYGIFSK